jgi:hypothetical protein
MNAIEGDHRSPIRTPQPLDKEGRNVKVHAKLGDKNENGNKVSMRRNDEPVKGKDQRNLEVEDSSRGKNWKGEEYAGLKGNKELEGIDMGPSTDSTLAISSIPAKNKELEIMGNAPNT